MYYLLITRWKCVHSIQTTLYRGTGWRNTKPPVSSVTWDTLKKSRWIMNHIKYRVSKKYFDWLNLISEKMNMKFEGVFFFFLSFVFRLKCLILQCTMRKLTFRPLPWVSFWLCQKTYYYILRALQGCDVDWYHFQTLTHFTK